MTGPAAPVATGVVLDNVTRRFGDQVVLDHFTLSIAQGAVTALMGPNGSGKTTVARLVLGLDRPQTGSVRRIDRLRRAAVFQEDRLCGHLSAIGNVRLVLDRSDWPRAEDDLRRLGIDDASSTKPVRDLSGGQRRKVAIVRALAAQADLVVLDEPFAGLDTDSRSVVLDFVLERIVGAATLLVTHDRADATFFGARVVRLP